MAKSSIAKQLHAGAGSSAATEVGRRVRQHRIAIGMTQAELAAPMSRAFVSAVEKGQALPSLGALWLFARRLGTGVGALVDDVNGIDTAAYTPVHDEHGARPQQSQDHSPADPHRRR